uniref:NAD(P)(+)--arginine ADP-ribosyltransferase n=1 Tax=Hemiselmis andersenii TaxID=464988 RepID=A0A6T8PQE4_HEMAN|mmetsp:Transcript_40474/g.98394  ORF Transcript_40474/g.98394 Transcript_40474/m.98394 type:complete len:900 (+) Transcript_40474:176-2875(+)
MSKSGGDTRTLLFLTLFFALCCTVPAAWPCSSHSDCDYTGCSDQGHSSSSCLYAGYASTGYGYGCCLNGGSGGSSCTPNTCRYCTGSAYDYCPNPPPPVCNAGFFVNAQNVCEKCKAGTYTGQAGSSTECTTCTSCPTGWSSSCLEEGSTVDECRRPCSSNSDCDYAGCSDQGFSSSSCQHSGYESTGYNYGCCDAASSCTLNTCRYCTGSAYGYCPNPPKPVCDAGSFVNEQNVCELCASGTYTSEAGSSTECITCSSGTVCPTGSESSCLQQGSTKDECLTLESESTLVTTVVTVVLITMALAMTLLMYVMFKRRSTQRNKVLFRVESEPDGGIAAEGRPASAEEVREPASLLTESTIEATQTQGKSADLDGERWKMEQHPQSSVEAHLGHLFYREKGALDDKSDSQVQPALMPSTGLHRILVCGEPASFFPVTDKSLLRYTIAPSLPVGLTFSPSTGAITGSPEGATPYMEYVVTAENAGGKETVRVCFATSPMYDDEAVVKWSEDEVQLWLEKSEELELDENVRSCFKGVSGSQLVALSSSDSEFWKGPGAKVDRHLQKLLKKSVADLVRKSEEAAGRKVLSEDELRVLEETAGVGRTVGNDFMTKFDEVFSLKTGRPAEAASGLVAQMCVQHKGFHDMLQKEVGGIEAEVAALADKYVGREEEEEAKEVGELLNYILYEGSKEKAYANGVRDQGRAEGTRLDYFTGHKRALVAELSTAEVVALRLYTTVAYKFMNMPLRDDDRKARSSPCPLPVTTYYAAEGIKKLRKLNAPGSEHGDTSNGVTLWRGMRKVQVTPEFLEMGGTELAFMSTTTSLEVAVQYSVSGNSLLFKILAGNFMVIGAELQWLSAFPAENEVLYPPLTYLKPTGKRQTITVQRGDLSLKFTVLEVEPTMG